MAKVGKTKTHVKIYLTPLEVEAYAHLVGEGMMSQIDVRGGENPPAHFNRVEDTVNEALQAAEQIRSGN